MSEAWGNEVERELGMDFPAGKFSCRIFLQLGKKFQKTAWRGHYEKKTQNLLRIFYAKPPTCFLLPFPPHYRPL